MKKFVLFSILLVIFFGNVSTTGGHENRREEYERVVREIEQDILVMDVELEELDLKIKETEKNLNNNFMSLVDKALSDNAKIIAYQKEQLKQLDALKTENINLKIESVNLKENLLGEESENKHLNEQITKLENNKNNIQNNCEQNRKKSWISGTRFWFWYS